MIEGNTVTAMARNTFQREQHSKWLPRSPQVTFKMGPDIKMIVLVTAKCNVSTHKTHISF